MKAWRFYALGEMRLDEVPYPTPKPGWVTLKVKVVQPSVTEAIRARGGPTVDADLIKRRIEKEAPVQLLGHEFCAEVVELGEGVTSLSVGDRVAAVKSKTPCKQCALCKTGQQDRCKSGPSIGRHMPGAFAEYISVPFEPLVKLPQNISDNEGACIQSLSSSMATVADTNIKVGDTVVILGQGVMGLNILQLSRVSGAGVTIGVDIKPTNLKLSRLLGADYPIDASKEDVVAIVKDLTHGLGADIVFECAGGSPKEGLSGSKSLEQALQIVADAGKVIQVANIGPKIEFWPDILRKKSIRYIFPHSSSSLSPLLYQHTVRLVANGQVKVKPTITHVLSGLDKVPESFEITANKSKYDAVNPAQVLVSQ